METIIKRIDTGVRHEVIPGQGFPPLMKDTRENNLANVEVGKGEMVYVKAIAGPYVGTDGLHMMVLPDFKTEKDILEVTDITVGHLSKALEIAGGLAAHAFEEIGIEEVNVGIHTAKDEWVPNPKQGDSWEKTPKQRIKNFKNLHIHVEAAVYEDKPKIKKSELRRDPEYYGKTPEPFEKIGYQVLQHEILPKLKNDGFPVEDFFEEIADNQGRLRLKLLKGKETFKDPELAEFLQLLDVEGQKAYDSLAGCFFERENDSFREDGGKYLRYKLLPVDERRKRIDEYIQKRDWLSAGSKGGLRLFTSMAQEAETVMSREISNLAKWNPEEHNGLEKPTIAQIANRFMAFRGFSYATLFSGMKDKNGDVHWTLGIRPSVFLVEGFVEMANTYGIIVKHADQPYSENELAEVQSRERRVISKVQNEITDLKNGPGLINGI